MKIAWFCIPAHGHTNPTLGVVKELTGAGHQVYYFSFEMFREKIEKAGAVFVGCDGYDFDMEDKDNADRVGKDKVFATELLVSSTLALDEMTTAKVKEIKPDLVVSDSVAFWGKLVAMKHGLPYVSSTTTFAFNRYSAKYMEESPWDIAKMLVAMPRINKQIKRLREKGYPVKGLLDIVQNDNETNTIVYTSKYFQPCADTFSDRYHFIGPSIRPIAEPVAKTAEKTVYISMGTVNQNREFYRNCIHVLGKTDWQVIISMGTNTEHFDDLPKNIQIHETVDQMAVLSIADAFITHCGMNSASEGLYFQVPLVLFPQTPEQGAVAKRVKELGAGVMLDSISEEDILRALQKVLTDHSYKENAVRISDSFHSCGGVAEARAFLEEVSSADDQTKNECNMGFTLFERWSPEYALNNAFEDMRESGLDGLKKHLTANALKSVKNLETISNISEVSILSKAVMGDNPVNILLDKLSECEWIIKDVMKGSETTKAIVGFNYQDNLIGTIEMKMIKEDSIWKIDSLAMPKFDKVALPQIELEPSDEA